VQSCGCQGRFLACYSTSQQVGHQNGCQTNEQAQQAGCPQRRSKQSVEQSQAEGVQGRPEIGCVPYHVSVGYRFSPVMMVPVVNGELFPFGTLMVLDEIEYA